MHSPNFNSAMNSSSKGTSIRAIFDSTRRSIADFSEDGLVFDIPDVSFDDIAGHNNAKTRLHEVINFLKE